MDNPLGAAAYDNLNKLLEIEAGSILLQKVLSIVSYHHQYYIILKNTIIHHIITWSEMISKRSL